MISSALEGFDFLTEVIVLVAMRFNFLSFAMFVCVRALCPQIIAPYVGIGLTNPVYPHFMRLACLPITCVTGCATKSQLRNGFV